MRSLFPTVAYRLDSRRYYSRKALINLLKMDLRYDAKELARRALKRIGLALASDLEFMTKERRAAVQRNRELGERFDAYRSNRVGRAVISDGPGRAVYPLRAPAFPL